LHHLQGSLARAFPMLKKSTVDDRCYPISLMPPSEPGTSQTKMLDLMISTLCLYADILKQDAEPQTSKTPSNRTQFRPSRFRTEPSVDR
jgi:hypothetical protein